jgi:acetyl-CoA acyltransferase
MLMGPSYATPLALKRCLDRLEDLKKTLMEMHEAFAAQTLANMQMFSSKKSLQQKLELSF